MASNNQKKKQNHNQQQAKPEPVSVAQSIPMPVGATVIVSESLPDGGTAVSRTVESAIISMPQNIASVPQNLVLPTEKVVETASQPTQRKPRQRYNVDAATFLTTVNTAKSKAEAAKLLGMPLAAVTSRMQYYRNVEDAEGNKLDVRSFQRGPNRLSISAINNQVRAAIQAANPTVQAVTVPAASAPENNVG